MSIDDARRKVASDFRCKIEKAAEDRIREIAREEITRLSPAPVGGKEARCEHCLGTLKRRVAELEGALRDIDTWSKAYPISVFPEPDFKKARALLEAGGMTLDAVSASNMRHVVEGVGVIARRALTDTPETEGKSPEGQQ